MQPFTAKEGDERLAELLVTQLGLRLGGRISERTREGAERLAGTALTALGLALLAEKLLI